MTDVSLTTRPTDDQRHGALICLDETFRLVADADGPDAAHKLLVQIARASRLLDTTDVDAVRDEYLNGDRR